MTDYLDLERRFGLLTNYPVEELLALDIMGRKPQAIRCDNGPENISATLGPMGPKAGQPAQLHSARQTAAERLD